MLQKEQQSITLFTVFVLSGIWAGVIFFTYQESQSVKEAYSERRSLYYIAATVFSALLLSYAIYLIRSKKQALLLAEAKEEQEQLLRLYASKLPDPCFIIAEDGTYMDIIGPEDKLFIFTAEQAIGRNLGDFYPPREVQEVLEVIRHTIESGEPQVTEYTPQFPFGGTRCFEVRTSPIDRLVEEKRVAMMVVIDITSRKQALEHIQFMTDHDSVTGLLNRSRFEKELLRLTAPGLPTSLIVFDIHGLRSINNAFGYQAGNDLLLALAHVLKQVGGKHFILGRIGDDELAAILPESDAASLEAYRSAVLAQIELYNQLHPEPALSVLVGQAFSNGTTNPSLLLRTADEAILQQKQALLCRTQGERDFEQE